MQNEDITYRRNSREGRKSLKEYGRIMDRKLEKAKLKQSIISNKDMNTELKAHKQINIIKNNLFKDCVQKEYFDRISIRYSIY